MKVIIKIDLMMEVTMFKKDHQILTYIFRLYSHHSENKENRGRSHKEILQRPTARIGLQTNVQKQSIW